LSFPEAQLSFFDRCFDDTIRLFAGQYPGYLACKTEYHDLRHTMEVLLATARMIHATLLAGTSIRPEVAELALLAALMHDIGYIQKKGETGPGGQYTLVHVERSADFFASYGETIGLTFEDRQRCCSMITATSLAINPDHIDFPDEDTKLAAKLVASADLLGQLADRIYLEKLLFLYQEFHEAGLIAYANEFELLNQTSSFYNIIRNRLDESLGGLDRNLRLHFSKRWKIDRNLYNESITLNLQFLGRLLKEHRRDYRSKLKRGGIVDRIKHAEAAA
jgi:hypothetical protein